MSQIVFAANITKLRMKRKLSIADVARDLDVTWERVNNWETGICYPKMNLLLKVCDYYEYKDIYNLLTTPIE